ncbi:MAG: LamG-like jellyroll fold domain-containing protein [Bryobacteraceae bacterium]
MEYSSPGQRVFNVTVNGTQVLTNFDIVAQAGYWTAIDKQFPVTVSGGSIQISVHGTVSVGLVNAIQIVPLATPALQLSGNSLNFAATVGGSNPAAQPVTISNTGGGTLNWTAKNTQSWLTLSAASGTAPSTLNVMAAVGSLTANTYTDTITINGGSAGTQTVTVTFVVGAVPPPPVLSVGSSSLTFSANAGGPNPASQNVSITNTGGGTLSWTASATQPWVILPVTSGTAPASLSIGVSTSGLAQGKYTDTVTISDPGVAGSPVSVGITLNVGPPAPANSAAFVKLDSTTQGNWQNAYGGDGYDFLGAAPSLPAYAQFTVNGAATYTWAASTSDIRALQQVSGGNRIAATWYSSSSFSFNLNLTGGTHQVAVYALDYDRGSRAERVDILDGATNAVLDTETINNFQPGQYLVWNLGGNVVIRVTPLSGTNGVVSGIFFGGPPQSQTQPPASPVLSLSTGSLTFSATAGGSNPASQPVTISNTGGGTLSWTAGKTQPWLTLSASSGTAPASLSIGVNTSGLAAGTWTDTVTISASGAGGSPATVSVTLNLSNASPVLSLSTGTLTFSGVAGGSNPVSLPVTISNTGGGTLSWTAGKTQSWLTLSAASGTAPAILSIGANTSGLASGTWTDTVTITASGATGSPATVAVTLNLTSSASASFLKLDTTTQGNWKSVYGGDGSSFVGGTPALPAYAQLTVNGAATFQWYGATSDPRALQPVTGTTRVAGVWYSSSQFSLDVNLTDGNPHEVAIYAMDYDNSGRAERVDVLDSGPGTVLDTRNLSGFLNGQYLAWTLTGHVVIRVTPTGGPNGVVNGIFFGGAPQQAPPPPPASPVLSLSTGSLTLAASAGGANPASQSVTISNTGGGTLSWTAGKTQSWLTLSATSGNAPASLSIAANTSSLAVGTYSDTVTITAAGVTGSPATVTVTLNVGGPSSVSFIKLDTTTEGNWETAYGADGYDFVAATPQLPTWMQLAVNGASTFQWYGATSQPNALQPVTGSNRVAAVWYSPSAFALDVNLTDGNAHQIELYASDYDGSGRVQRIDVLDSTTGSVLDTRTMSSFQTGQYLVWSMMGHVVIRVTPISGPNAVVNGIFLGSAYQQSLPPGLVVSENALTFFGTAGGTNPVAQNISITNTGGGTLNWTAAKTQPWVSLSSSSGTTAGSLAISVLTAGLPAGSYTDTVTVTAPGALGSPATIGVTMLLGVQGTQGPLAEWTFDAGTITGNTALDTSGNGLNASIVGNPVQGPGVSGQALTFDGSTSYLVTQPDPRPAMTGDLTLAAWIKTTNTSRNETILSKYNSSGSEDGYIFETTAAGYVGVHIGGDNVSGVANQDALDGANKINDGNWHHVAAVMRLGQDISLYVDGGLSSIYYLTTFGGAIGSGVGIAGPVSRANLFTGSMDDVRIYTRALSTTEIAQIYGGNVTTVSGGQILYNGISMPVNFPPPTTPTQAMRTPYYISNGPRVLPIDVGRQLFVDDFLIEQTTLQRTQHQPTMYPNPLPIPGSPISAGAWFDPASNLYKLWYYNGVTNDYRYTYSTDGMNWTLPTYPDVLVPNTNEVVTGGDTIWLDQQETNPARRYKSFGVDVGAGLVYVYFSADGIHWTGPNNYGIITLSDRTTVFWNPFRKVWVNSDRSSTGFAATPLRDAQDTRARFYSESSNLTTWTPATPAYTFWTGADDHDPPYYLNNPGGQPPELYNLDAVAYESVMVGLFSWFYPGIGYSNYNLPGPILVELGVGFSRDGFSWFRPTRGSGPNAGGAFIPASDMANTWNAYNTQSVGGGFLVVGDELWFYFSGRSLQKPNNGTFSTGLATLRRDGFYSMDAGSTPGTLVTHPLNFSGSHLFVNVNDPSGQLTVDVLDANGNVIPGFAAANCVPLSVNKTMQEVTWNGASIGSLAGQNVKLRFNLTNGSLYSFWVTASAQGASNGYVAAGGPGFTGVTDTVGSAGQP